MGLCALSRLVAKLSHSIWALHGTFSSTQPFIEWGVLMLKVVLVLLAAGVVFGCGGGDGTVHTSPAYSLTLNAGPNGKLAADPAGPTYAPRTLVNLTATPDAQITPHASLGTAHAHITQPTNHGT